jgi:hypothetical protein
MSPVHITLYDIHRELKDAMRVEKLVHKHFNDQRLHGEWFLLTDNQVDQLRRIIYEYDVLSVVKIQERKLTTVYEQSFKMMIETYFDLLKDTEFKFDTQYKRRRPLIAKRLGISDGNLARLIAVYKYDPKLIDDMDRGNITINSAYLSVKNP